MWSAFKTVKKWLLDAKVQNAELQLKLQQIREKKLGPHSRVYQERDELHSHLQKSYQAFSEKYGENEQLKKTIQELKEALRLSQETNAQVIQMKMFGTNCYTLSPRRNI